MTSGEEQPQTWHHGIVASWWAEFNVGGPEIPYFRKSSTPYADASLWRHWLKEERQALPKPWRELGEGDRRRGSDGAEYELRSRIVELDPLSQCVTLEMRADRWRDGEHVAEEHVLRMSLYFTHELVAMLERAGFTDVILSGDYTDEEPNSDTEFVVFQGKEAANGGHRPRVTANTATGEPRAVCLRLSPVRGLAHAAKQAQARGQGAAKKGSRFVT